MTARGAPPAAPRPRRGWRVYLLRCCDGSLYAGATNDLARRLTAHAAGAGARYTRSRLPVALVWTARARDRSAALRREAALKRLSRAEKLELIAVPRGRAQGQADEPAPERAGGSGGREIASGSRRDRVAPRPS